MAAMLSHGPDGTHHGAAFSRGGPGQTTLLRLPPGTDPRYMMGPLAFVNWRVVNEHFCTLMWVIAVVLAVVVLTHLGGSSADAHHVASAGVLRTTR